MIDIDVTMVGRPRGAANRTCQAQGCYNTALVDAEVVDRRATTQPVHVLVCGRCAMRMMFMADPACVDSFRVCRHSVTNETVVLFSSMTGYPTAQEWVAAGRAALSLLRSLV